jgi:formylmethanofuran:tetrahydromethanopterin formyltransferase
MDISNVLQHKFGHQPGMETVEGVITKFPGGIPSQADQDKWTKEYEDHMVSIAYKEKRKVEYDKLNQFELIGEDSINGTTNHRDAIIAIKDKYPKE